MGGLEFWMHFKHPNVPYIETEYYKSYIKNTLKILMLPALADVAARRKCVEGHVSLVICAIALN
jgi:hypothetical protein